MRIEGRLWLTEQAAGLLHLPLATFCDELPARSFGDTNDDVVILATRLPGA